MKRILAVVFPLVVLLPMTTQGQEWTAEQMEVWQVVEESWVADNSEDPGWIDRMVHPKLQGWDTSLPMPRDFETFKQWSRYNDANGDVLEFSAHPVAIVVHGNTAVAFYYGSIATEDLKGDRETTHFREVDVLVRDNGVWKFLAWMGADEPSQGG